MYQCSYFVPTFPATSPYVTSVGGFEADMTTDPYSSGGFSNMFKAMDYQTDAVNAYLTHSTLPPKSYLTFIVYQYWSFQQFLIQKVGNTIIDGQQMLILFM